MLPVICGTDTLGVGINVPIHTVVLTALTKFDGYKMRRLRAREFHQIAGRAGRSGFDTEGMVIAEAPEHEIENAKLMAKAGDDPKKLRKIKKKKAPEGFVTWNKQTFERLIETQPETLKPRLRITHSMVISVVEQGGNAVPAYTTSSRQACKRPRKRQSSRFAPTRSSPRSSTPASSCAPRCRSHPTPQPTPRPTSTMR